LWNKLISSPRWVVSDKFWTSSGVTAGIDMAAAFLKHFIAAHVEPARVKDVADQLLGVLEVT
jgi:transcriptional regulator GlxA family with amidase domain